MTPCHLFKDWKLWPKSIKIIFRVKKQCLQCGLGFYLIRRCKGVCFGFEKKKIKMYTSHSLFSLKSGWRQSIRDSISCAFWWKGRRLPLAVMDDGVWQISPTINKTTSLCIEVALYFPFRFFQTIETRNELTPKKKEKIFIFKIKEENQSFLFNGFFFQDIKFISQFYQRNLYMRTISSLNSSGFLNQHQGALTLYVSILRR